MKRMPNAALASVLALLLLAAACEDRSPTPFDPLDTPEEILGTIPLAVGVMSRNLYHGAALDPLFAPEVTARDIPVRAAGIWGRVVASDFAARAEVLAREIDLHRPSVVGLQEVALFRIQTPGDAAMGGRAPATEEVLDYLRILLDALAARGIDYEVVASVQNIDAELPMVDPSSPTGLSDIRLTDRDVILVRGDVHWRDPRAGRFSTLLPVQLGPIPLDIPRGWTSVIVDDERMSFRFFNTHPEAFHPAVRHAQTGEVVSLLGGETLPVVLVGDLNAEPGEPPYRVLANAGFQDAWGSVGGFTCCHAPDLRNAMPSLTKRIDYVLLRGEFPLAASFDASVRTEIVGSRRGDQTPSGLWPSDHAGLVTTLLLRRSRP